MRSLSRTLGRPGPAHICGNTQHIRSRKAAPTAPRPSSSPVHQRPDHSPTLSSSASGSLNGPTSQREASEVPSLPPCSADAVMDAGHPSKRSNSAQSPRPAKALSARSGRNPSLVNSSCSLTRAVRRIGPRQRDPCSSRGARGCFSEADSRREVGERRERSHGV